jgi:diguanylate cyclase (GGDEF)-like protein/PAS domain S-box-containing protein
MQYPPDLLRVTLQSIRDAVVTTDTSACVMSMNLAAETMTGWSAADAVGLPIDSVIDLRERIGEVVISNPAHTALRDGTKVEMLSQTLLIAKGGMRTAIHLTAHPLKNSDGTFGGAVLIFYDLTEVLQLADRQSYMAQHDPLTGLPNRILLVDRMEQATKFADRHSDQMAVLSLDIDRFSEINATYGNSIADELLKEVAFRITDVLRESDTVSRLGADDFIVLLPGVTSRADVESLASKLLRAVAEPVLVGEYSMHATCTIGISLYPQDAIDAAALMRMADTAMLQAKKHARGRYLFAKEEDAPAGKTSD